MKSHPTPRYILRDIVEPAVNEILHAPELFPYFCSNKHNMLPEESEIESEILWNYCPFQIMRKNRFLQELLR